MMGTIPFVSPYTKEKYWYVLYENKRNSKELPAALKKKFDNLQLSLVEYREITDQQQRDVFRESCCAPRDARTQHPDRLELGSSRLQHS